MIKLIDNSPRKGTAEMMAALTSDRGQRGSYVILVVVKAIFVTVFRHADLKPLTLSIKLKVVNSSSSS